MSGSGPCLLTASTIALPASRLLSGGSGADHRSPPRRHYRLCRATAPLGGRKIARLVRPMAPAVQGLRGTARGLRGNGHPRRDPPNAPSPRPSQSQATARRITFKTGCKIDGVRYYLKPLTSNVMREIKFRVWNKEKRKM